MACSLASTSPLRQFTAFSPNDILAAQTGDGAFDGGGAGGALADFAGQLAGEPCVFGLGHQGQRLRDALVGKQVQKWRLLQLCRKPLPQRAVEDRIAGGVGEIGENDGVLLGEPVRGLARAEIEHSGDRSNDKDHGSGNQNLPEFPAALQELRRPSRRPMTQMEQAQGMNPMLVTAAGRLPRPLSCATVTVPELAAMRSSRFRSRFSRLQIGAHFRGVLVAQLAVFLQRLVDDVFQLGRHIGIQPHRREPGAFENGVEDHGRSFRREMAMRPVAIS